MDRSFGAKDFADICDELGARDADLARAVALYGYPPLWSRPNSYESLVHIILEQQVSLASALAALEKLRERVGLITPKAVMALTDEELRACYFSRQKTGYVRNLTQAMLSQKLDLLVLEQLSNDEIRMQLIAYKGIGNWTIDVYLIMVLHRADLFPIGDIAMVNGLKHLKGLAKSTTQDALLIVAEPWRPYRSVAAMLLWHFYLSTRHTV